LSVRFGVTARSYGCYRRFTEGLLLAVQRRSPPTACFLIVDGRSSTHPVGQVSPEQPFKVLHTVSPRCSVPRMSQRRLRSRRPPRSRPPYRRHPFRSPGTSELPPKIRGWPAGRKPPILRLAWRNTFHLLAILRGRGVKTS